MNNTVRSFKYLIFSGGGAAGLAFAGAVDQLSKEPEFSFDKIEQVAGTSIGSLAALMVSLKYTPAEFKQKLMTQDLQKIADGGWLPEKVLRLYSAYGIYKSQGLYNIILGLIKEKIGGKDPEKVTFADLIKMGFKSLHVVTTKIYTLNGMPTGKRKVFSVDKTPNTSIAAAILASCAAPIYFQRVRLKKVAKGEYVLSEDGDLYNDGGLVSNLDLDIFDKARYVTGDTEDPDTPAYNPYSLGLSIVSSDSIVDPWHLPKKGPVNDYSPLTWGEGVLNTLGRRRELDGLEKTKYYARTVQIDRLNVSLADFDIDEKTKLALEDSGRLAVSHYFTAMRHPEIYDMHKLKEEAKNLSFAAHKVQPCSLWHQDRDFGRANDTAPAIPACALAKK